MNTKPDSSSITEAAALSLDQMLAEPGGAIPKHQDCAKAVMRHGLFQRFCDRVQSWFEIPYGFQDELGFHYGRPAGWDRDHAAGRMAAAPPQSGSA